MQRDRKINSRGIRGRIHKSIVRNNCHASSCLLIMFSRLTTLFVVHNISRFSRTLDFHRQSVIFDIYVVAYEGTTLLMATYTSFVDIHINFPHPLLISSCKPL